MVKKIVLGLFMFFSIAANAHEDPTKDLTDEQKYVLVRAYEIGNERGYGLTLAAIALKESRAGKYLVNNRSKDYGVFQNNIKSTTRRIEMLTGHKMDWKTVQALKTELVSSLETSANYAMMELEYWDRVHKGNWRRVVESYNAGYGRNPVYVEAIAKNIQYLKKSKILKV